MHVLEISFYFGLGECGYTGSLPVTQLESDLVGFPTSRVVCVCERETERERETGSCSVDQAGVQ